MKHRLHCNSWLIPTGLSILSKGKIIFCAQERLPIGNLAKLCKKQPSGLQGGGSKSFDNTVHMQQSWPSVPCTLHGRAGGRRGDDGRRGWKG